MLAQLNSLGGPGSTLKEKNPCLIAAYSSTIR